jgi:tetratricopeptide (TPR) repeat protein
MIKEALCYLQKGYELFNDKPDLLNNYGLALYNSNRIDDAKIVLERCIALDKDHYKAYNNLGNVYRRIKKYDQALEYYKKSVELSMGQHVTAYINIASTFLNQKDLFGCIDCIEKAAEVNKNDIKRVLRFCGLYQLIVHENVKKTII